MFKVKHFTPCSSVSVVYFEQANADWGTINCAFYFQQIATFIMLLAIFSDSSLLKSFFPWCNSILSGDSSLNIPHRVCCSIRNWTDWGDERCPSIQSPTFNMFYNRIPRIRVSFLWHCFSILVSLSYFFHYPCYFLLLKARIVFYLVFREHSRFTGQQGKGEALSLTPL